MVSEGRKPKITIILADDILVIEGLRGLLSHEPDMKLMATVTSGEALLDELQYTRPDLVVLDVHMQDGDGFWCLEEFGARVCQ
ncbi:MAG: response regulator [Kouleothrix sp.]